MMLEEETLTEPKKLTPEHLEEFDLIIVGAGPAGMSAALCAARAELKVLVIEKSLPGGETSTACLIDNYLGFPQGIMGEKLSETMENHMFQYQIYYTCETVEDIAKSTNNFHLIRTDLGNAYKGKGVILATGLEQKKLNDPFEKKFFGRGLSYCAPCDAFLYKNKTVAVIGSGNCACYAADLLSNYAQKIYIIHGTSELKAVKSLKAKILANPKIDLIWNSRVIDIFGIDSVEKIKLDNSLTAQQTWLDVKGLFVYIGRVPTSQIYNINIKKDESNFIITDEYMRTNIDGIYAAGDIRSKQIRQIATAVSDGMIAAINAERDLKLKNLID